MLNINDRVTHISGRAATVIEVRTPEDAPAMAALKFEDGTPPLWDSVENCKPAAKAPAARERG